MPLWSLTQERVDKLLRQIGDKEAEVDVLIQLSKEDLWKKDLDEFIAEWRFQLEDEHQRQRNIVKGRRTSKKFKTAFKGPAVKKRKGLGDASDDSDFDIPKNRKAAAAAKQTTLPFKKPARVVSSPKTKSPWDQTNVLENWKRKGSTDGASDDPDVVESDDFDINLGATKPVSKPKTSKTDPGAKLDVKAKVKVSKSTTSASSKGLSKSNVAKIESDTEDITGKPIARQARAATKKPVKYSRSSDSDSDNGDDLLGDVSNMVKGLPALNGDSRQMFSASASTRPSSSAGYKAVPRAPSRIVDEDDDDETDYTKLVPQQSPRKSIGIVNKDSAITDEDEDDDDLDIRPASRAPPRAPAVSARPVKASASATAVKPPKKTIKKAVAPPSKKNPQSPVAKAYAKRLAKKTVVDSDDDIDAMADDILDSPASDGSVEEASAPARTSTARPARRAATTTKKTTYAFDDDDSDEVHSEEEPSAMFSESE